MGTINSIQYIINFKVPFILKSQKLIERKNKESESDKSPDEQPDNSLSVVKSKVKNKKCLKGGGEIYDFEETFNKTVESLKK